MDSSKNEPARDEALERARHRPPGYIAELIRKDGAVWRMTLRDIEDDPRPDSGDAPP